MKVIWCSFKLEKEYRHIVVGPFCQKSKLREHVWQKKIN